MIVTCVTCNVLTALIKLLLQHSAVGMLERSGTRRACLFAHQAGPYHPVAAGLCQQCVRPGQSCLPLGLLLSHGSQHPPCASPVHMAPSHVTSRSMRREVCLSTGPLMLSLVEKLVSRVMNILGQQSLVHPRMLSQLQCGSYIDAAGRQHRSKDKFAASWTHACGVFGVQTCPCQRPCNSL